MFTCMRKEFLGCLGPDVGTKLMEPSRGFGDSDPSSFDPRHVSVLLGNICLSMTRRERRDHNIMCILFLGMQEKKTQAHKAEKAARKGINVRNVFSIYDPQLGEFCVKNKAK